MCLQVSELLPQDSTGSQMILLERVGHALSSTNTNTVFVNRGDMVNALLANGSVVGNAEGSA